MERQILHIDVNNAFLSWLAVYMLKNNNAIDIRTIPAIIGGDEEARKGIVLAKSMKAKECRNCYRRANISSKKKMFRITNIQK